MQYRFAVNFGTLSKHGGATQALVVVASGSQGRKNLIPMAGEGTMSQILVLMVFHLFGPTTVQ